MNKKDKEEINELDPKCFDRRQHNYGFTNRGELIPCCWLDNQNNRVDPKYQKLLNVSNIKEHDSIEDILLQSEWIEFNKNLAKGKGFPQCHKVCKKEAKFQRQTIYEPGFNKRVKET